MDKRNTTAELVISRWTGGGGTVGITIQVTDKASRICVAELSLTLSQFAGAITGLVLTDIPLTSLVSDPRIGVEQKQERRIAHCPLSSYTDRKTLKEWFDQNIFPGEGEVVCCHLGSLGAVRGNPSGGCEISYSALFWPVATKEGVSEGDQE